MNIVYVPYQLYNLLRLVAARVSFRPWQEIPELYSVCDGNSDDTPSDAYRPILGVGGRLQQLDTDVSKSDVNEKPQSCYLQRVHRLTSA